MAYIETIRRGKREFHYLTKTIRVGDAFRKIRRFLGKGKIPKKRLARLAQKAETGLKEKVKQVKKINTLYSLNRSDLITLENIRKRYKAILRKLSKVEYAVIEKQHLIKFTFNTNAIEGSTITLKETAHILEDKISPPGHDLREIHEIENTKKSYEFMKQYKEKITISFIKKIHYYLTFNILEEQAGIFRSIQVYMAGSKYVPTKPSEVQREMLGLLRWVRNHKQLHPVLLDAYVHHFFIAIHPFVDGNGRTGRLLLNFMLMKAGYPPICIRSTERIIYTNYLEKARDGDIGPFVQFIIKKVEEAYKELVDNTKDK